MARIGRPTVETVLSADERDPGALGVASRERPALVMRCRIVLAAAEAEANGAITAGLGCTRRRPASGAGSQSGASTAFMTSRARGSRARSRTPTWSG